MNVREFLLLLLVFGGFAVTAIVWTAGSSRRLAMRRRRLDLLEQGLQHPDLDAATRAELLRVLARDQRAGVFAALGRLLSSGACWRVVWYGSGWLMFVVGGCLLAARAMSLVPGPNPQIVLPMAITGFAVLTLPLALSELGRRRRPSTVGR